MPKASSIQGAEAMKKPVKARTTVIVQRAEVVLKTTKAIAAPKAVKVAHSGM